MIIKILIFLLSQNTNQYIYTDSHNLTWISSTAGLNCFTGGEVKVYDRGNYDILGKNIQSNFHEDSQSNLWFTTYEALNKYERSSDNFESFQFFGSEEKITANYRCIGLIDSILWVGADGYLFAFNINSNKIIKQFDFSFVGEDYLHCYAFKRNNHTYIFSSHTKLRGLKFDSFLNYKELSLPNVPMMRMAQWKGRLLMSTGRDRLLEFDWEQDEFINTESECPNAGLISANEEYILVSCDKKVLKCSNLNDCVVLSVKAPQMELYIDNNNVSWLSSDSEDLKYFQLDKKKFEFYNLSQNGDTTIAVNCFLHYDDYLWIGTRHQGVFKINPTNFDIIKHYGSGKDDSWKMILDIITIENEFYVKGLNRLYKYNSTKDTFLKCSEDMGLLLQLYNSPGRNKYLVETGGQNKNVYKLRVNKDLLLIEPIKGLSKMEKSVGAIQEDNFGNIYLSVEEEYLQILRNVDDEYNWDKKIEGHGLRSIWHFDHENTLYLGNSNGLFRIDIEKNFHVDTIRPQNYSINTTIYSILGNNKYLWLGSNDGLLRYDISNNLMHKFSLVDGIQDKEYNTRACYIDQDGYFYFGGVNGFNRFHPDSIDLLDIKPDVYVSSIEVNNEYFDFGRNQNMIDNLEFDFDQNTISFSFNSLDFSDPEATRVKFILENYEENWITSTTNKGFVRYPNLPPGNYQLKIKASNSDGIWNPKPKTIDITILPPWYATWWARTLGILLLSGILYYLFRSYYKRQLREKELALREANLTISKQKALAHERTRIAAEMHDDLGGGLTRIRFLSQRVLRTVTNNDLKSQVTKIVDLSEGLVRNMGEIIWAMDAGFDTLSSLISYVRRYAYEYLEDYGIDLTFDVQGQSTGIKLTGQQRRNVFLVIKEAIHNAVKHANTKYLTIEFQIADELKVCIKDKGIGIKNQVTNGNGLNNMRKRVEMLGGTIEIQNNGGTIITFNVPLEVS